MAKSTKTATTPKPDTAAKKAGASSADDKKNGIGIKYADKSGDQPELVPIFDQLKKLLLPYKKANMKLRGGSGGQVALVIEKPVLINGKTRNETWFAAALIQRGYVGFYFMPVNQPSQRKEIFGPELLKCLKGKSCFYIRKFDALIFKQVKEALAKGYLIYKQEGRL